MRRTRSLAIFAILAISVARPAASDEPSAAATRQYAVSIGFQTRGLYKPAAEEWRKFLTEFPQDPRRDKARHHLGACLLQDGQLDLAIAELTKVRTDHPQYPKLDSVLLNLGIAQLRKAEKSNKPEDLEAARREFEGVLQRFGSSPLAPKAAYFRAETFHRANKLAEASEAYAKVTRDYPQNELVPDALYALGVAYAAQKKPEQAAATFAELLQRFPKHALAEECRLRQGDALLVQAKYAEAEPLFAQAAAAPGFAHADYALLRQAACVLERGQPAQAADLYKSLPAKYPKSALAGAATLGTGKALYHADQYAPARQVLAALLDPKKPEGAEAAVWTGRCLIKEKNAAGALPILDAALAANPQGPAVPLLVLARADALFEIAERRPQALEAYLEFTRRFPDDRQAPQALSMAAFAAFAVGKYGEAKSHAAAFVARFPQHALVPEALFLAAESELSEKHWPEAAARYLELVQKFPQSPRLPEAKLHRGLALAMDKKYDEAVALLAAEIPNFKDTSLKANAHFVIGRARADQQRFDEAIAALRAALEVKPDWSRADETRLDLAFCYRVKDKLPEAVEQLQALLAAFPMSAVLDQALVQLGECESAQGKLDEALVHYRAAAQRDGPAASQAQLGVGRTLYRKGDAAGAIETINVLLQKSPRSEAAARARYVRGLAEHKLKQYAKALEDAEAFVASKPEANEALDAQLLAGLCQAALGQHEPAVSTFKALLAASPAYARADQVYYELGFSLQQLKREPEAADAFSKAAAAAPKGSLAAESLFRVGESLYARGKFAEAKGSYQAALAAATGPALREKSIHKLGWCAFRQQDWKNAASEFERQAAEAPAGPLLHEGIFMAGESLAKQDDWKSALERFQKVAAAKPAALHARALYRVGQAAGQLKNWAASAAAYADLIAAFPKFAQGPEARYGLAWALQNQEQYSQAVPIYEQVTRDVSTETAAKAQFMIGECYFAQKNHAEAARQFLKGAFGYPFEEWVGNCHFEAARCFEVLNQLDQARQSYQVLASKYPKHDKAKAAAERLKALGGEIGEGGELRVEFLVREDRAGILRLGLRRFAIMAAIGIPCAATPCLAAGGPAKSAAAAPAAPVRPSVGDLIRRGGPIMVPIGFCSVALTAFFLERLVSMRRKKVLPPGFIEELVKLRDNERLDTKSLEALCGQFPSPISNVVRASLLRQGHPLLEVEKVMEDAAAREISILRSGIRPLTAIASIAPLLGLVGTVFGMIDAFIVTSQPGLKDRTELLAAGIYVALVATAAGLLVAVPALIAAYYFTGRLDSLSRAMGDVLTPLVPSLTDLDRTGTPRLPAAAPAEREPRSRWK